MSTIVTKLPEAESRVLEDGEEALLQDGSQEAEIVGEGDDLGEEFASLDATDDAVDPDKPVAVVKPAKVVAKPVVAAAGDDELPAEFRGKTPKELVRMYQDAHSTIGRQGSELGEYRKQADQVIQASLRVLEASKQGRAPAAADVAAAKPLEESEIFAKPIDSINRLVENHPLVQEIKRTLGAAAARDALTRSEQSSERFNRTHPDAQETLRDPEFRAWVSASPIRRDLLLRANNNYDFAAGDEVFSTWKALKGRPTAAVVAAVGAPDAEAVKAAARTLAGARTAKAAQAAAAQAAAAPTGGASASPSGAGKKLYRRADVIRLMVDDPDRYEALSGELQLAYAENRVR